MTISWRMMTLANKPRDAQYRTNRRLPMKLKALFLKFWAAGAVFYFVGWGSFVATTDQLDLTVLIGLVMGIATDLVFNNILKMMERQPGESDKYIMFGGRKFISIFQNVLYAIVLSFLVAYTYHFINLGLINLMDLPKTSVPLGAEPILFGVFYLCYELLFLWLRHVIRARKNKED